jgi:hypothetical protein
VGNDEFRPGRPGVTYSRLRLGLMAATVLAGGAALGATLLTVTQDRTVLPAVVQAAAPASTRSAPVSTTDPRVLMQAAERARARGDSVAAVRDLERARVLRAQQLGMSVDTPDDSTLAYVSLKPGAAPLESRTTPRVMVAAAGSGRAPAVAPPVYAGADLGQDAPDPLAIPPSLRAGSRPTPLTPNVRAPSSATRAASASTDALNARQMGGQPTIASAPLAAPYGVPVPSKQVVEAGSAPVYPGLATPENAPVLAADQRYQPQLQEFVPKYRPAPAAPVVASASMMGVSTMPPLEVAGDFSRSDLAPIGESDPLLRDIDRNIVELRDSLSPAAQVGYGYRYVSGEKGLSKLTDETIPLEAVYTPGESGQIKLTVTREYLTSGTFNSSDLGLQTFGTIALGLSKPFVVGSTYVPPAYAGQRPQNQNAQGTGINVQYQDELVTADVGATPIGFKVQNIVGGVQLTPQLTDRLRLRAGVARRAVTESLLSYAGTVDPRTGATWGGVVHDRGTIGLEYGDGDLAAYVNGGGGQLTGKHVANNTEYGASGGVSYPVWRGDTDEIRVGLDLMYEAYAKNLGYFTYGQGGYFSPQRYFSALVPVTYRGKVGDDLTYEASAALGLQDFAQKASNYYPKDGDLQAQLNAMLPVGGLSTSFGRKTVSGLAGNVRGRMDYRVSTNLRVGGQFSYQHSGDYDEAMASIYARYIFNGTNRR